MTMRPEALRVLLIEDDEDDFLITRSMLRSQHRFSVALDWVDSYGAGLVSMREGAHDLYIVDYRLGQETGLDLIRDACGCEPKAPVILLTGENDYEVDLQATELGVTDYLVKGALDAAGLER